MHTNLLIIVAVVVVLAAQGGTVYVVRRMVRRWCSDVYRAGRRSGVLEAEPFTESYRLGYDVGFEAGQAAR